MMGENSKIEWTDHTFNPWWGCTKVSDGCTHCYADTLSTRWGMHIWGPKAERRFFGEKHWQEPLKWNRDAERDGQRRRVFCASMADVFERHMLPNINSLLGLARARLWELIEQTPMLDWLLLTKRPEHIRDMVPVRWLHEPPLNVWYGTSVENQEYADRRIPELLRVPARVRFLSVEPLLGPVDLQRVKYGSYTLDVLSQRYTSTTPEYGSPFSFGMSSLGGIRWVIAGGESGAGARPCHPDWARQLRDQCQGAGVAFFFKQWGEWAPFATTAGYAAGTLMPGSDEVVGGDCGGPVGLSNFEKGRASAHVRDGTEIRARVVLDNAEHRWGKENRLCMTYVAVGKKAAGRLLDGREWSQFP
jgi:protein gp37